MPAGYTTYYVGTYSDLVVSGLAAAQEEAAPVGTLMLLELHLSETPSSELLMEAESQLRSVGVPPWEGYGSVVSVDDTDPQKVYVAWVKGQFWQAIIGIVILLPIAGGFLWKLIPQGIKDMITMVIMMIVMVPIMRMMTKER